MKIVFLLLLSAAFNAVLSYFLYKKVIKRWWPDIDPWLFGLSCALGWLLSKIINGV